MFGSAFGDFMGNKGLRSRQAAEEDDDFDSADMYSAANLSTIELELGDFREGKGERQTARRDETPVRHASRDLGLFSFAPRLPNH